MSNFVIAQGIIVLIGVLVYSLFFRKKREALLPLPPGPKPIPILGNIRDGPPPGVPEFEHWVTFKDKYGPINSQLGTKHLASQYVDTQDVESKRFLLRILMDPLHLFKHIKTQTASTILKLTYGYSAELHGPDPLTALINKVVDNASAILIPFSWAVDLFPFLSYLPDWFPGFKQTAREWRGLLDASADIPYAFAKQQMEKGSYQPSYITKLISSFKEEGKEIDEEFDEAIRWTAGVMFAGGADTTVSTIKTFLLGMVLNPDVQRKAQEEIDRVVGTHRLPEASDEESLPYVAGVIKEALRTFPVVPMGLPHEAAEDIIFRGYRIPKGSFLRPCVWWYLHDPKTYANPSKFDPERYLEPRNEPDPMESFGYGRRICPGRFLAHEGLFITISRLLATFTISKAMHEGKPVDFEPRHVTDGALDHPADFPYSIAPRSEKHAEMIRRVEVDHPWDGGSARDIQGNAIFDKFKAECAAGISTY
ncbi:cytochrome p450 domain-containing protein [Trichoderma breve]|uniref:Cytochrome p450 domain-containing protein n=1 Tax=Trichoderma breve TaxID=2034170 RepID=A0A9W9BA28_9HYPO|nr:cytochrome p450 domain-containing protein [Trichoderma breve]KAJ4858734.1 cytochrome p450 domain-containing protein [Trichoderma breve]